MLCALSLVLYSQLKIENKFKPKEDDKKLSSLEVIRNPVFVVATSVAAIGYLVMAAMMDAFPITMLEHSMHFSDTTTVLQWHMLAMFGPSYLTARYINKFGASVAVYTGILFNLVVLLSALQGVLFFNFWICLFMIGLGWNLMYLSGTDMITNMPATERPRAEGLSSLAIMTSFALSAPLAAVILVNFGWQMVSLFSISLLFIAGTITLVNRRFVLKAYLPEVEVSS
jgi:MFS family permease